VSAVVCSVIGVLPWIFGVEVGEETGAPAVWRVGSAVTNWLCILWNVAGTVKRAFKFRFYPTEAQVVELSRTFGCVRKVYNLALAARAEAWTLRRERVTYNATSSMLTGWKKSEDLAFLNEVSSVPLQQTRATNAATAPDPRPRRQRGPQHSRGGALRDRRGAGVRPQRESSRTGRPAVKQENPRATKGIPSL
jgi:hypothetical protein